jgi:type I restriction enzyme S subunit
MKSTPLLNVVDNVTGGPAWFSGVRPYFATADIEGATLRNGVPVTFEDRPSRANLVGEPGDVLFAKMQATEKVFHITDEASEAIFSTGFFNLRPRRAKVHPRYLFWFLRSDYFQAEKDRLCTGATQKALNLGGLEKISIPLPDTIEEQASIAANLDKADAIRRKRDQALAFADDFLMSMFLEMFGDPITNDRQLPTASLAELTLKITDGEHQNPEFVTTGMPIVMAKQVQFDRIDIAQAKSVSIRDGLSFRRKCNPELGDILIVGRGATIGRCYAVDIQTEFCLMGSVILIKPDPRKISSRYLLKLLTHPGVQAKLVNTSSSSAQQAIYLSHLKEMKIVLPKIADQRHFEKLADAISHARLRGLESLHNSKKLFDSLSQRAFRGEL